MPLQITKIQAICFDVDGTLRDTDDQYVHTFARLFRPLRFLLPGRDEHHFARRFVMRVESPANWVYSLPDRFGLDEPINNFRETLYQRGFRKKNHHFLLVDGIHEMLNTLAGRFPMAVVSARDRRGTLAFLDEFDLTRYFKCIATAQTTPYTKPRPDPILWAAEQLGVSPEACLMVGDTTVDMRAGKAAGAQTVGVLCGFGEEDELVKTGADTILPSTSDLPTLLIDKIG